MRRPRRRRGAPEHVQIQRLVTAIDADSERAIPQCMAALTSRHHAVRAAAIDLLARFPHVGGARRAILSGFVDKSWVVRMQAAESAASLSTRDAILSLRRLLQDPHELVRVEAVSSLGFLQDRGARPRLYALLDDRSSLVRSYAAAAIGRLGGSRDRERLAKRFPRERDDAAKVGYYDAAFSLGDRTAIVELARLLDSHDFEVRCAAATTMVRRMADASNAADFYRLLKRRLRKEASPNTRACLRDNIRALATTFQLDRPQARRRSRI
jgi:HEAT repeat protein